MEGECCEILIIPDSNEIAVKRNVWNLLSLDIQLDVFRFLRAYDLHKKNINVSHQWRNTIKQHKGILPKFRQITDCRAQNKLVGDNCEENLRQREDISRREVEEREKHRRIREKWTQTYALLCIISFIAAIAAHPISIEGVSAILLLLAVSLRMGNTYAKFWIDLDKYSTNYNGIRDYAIQNVRIINKKYFTYNVNFLNYVWLAYLGTRIIVFAIVGVLRHLIIADNNLDALLWTLHFPEAAYVTNWAINACIFQYCKSFGISYYLSSRYRNNIERLRPDCGYIEYPATWLNELPTYINIYAWALAFPQLLIHPVCKFLHDTLFPLLCAFGFVFQYNRRVGRLNPDYRREDQHKKWYSDLPIHINIFAWALAFPQVLMNLIRELLLTKLFLTVYHILFVAFLYLWIPNGVTVRASIITLLLFCMCIIALLNAILLNVGSQCRKTISDEKTGLYCKQRRYSKDGMKEAAQNVTNEESDTASTEGNVQQSNDSKDHLRRVFISLGSTSIDTGNGDTPHQHNSPMKMTIRRAIIPDKKRSSSRSSVASPKKKRVPLKDTQSAGPAVDATAHSNQGLSKTNQSSPYSSSGEEVNEGSTVPNENDQHLTPTTSAQSVLNFPAEKLTIVLIRFDIGDGRVYYETPEYKMYDGPLSEHLLTLIHSEADVHGCETHFVFASVYGSIFTTHPKTVREEYEKFSQEVHSVSHLWTNGRVKTRLHEYPKHASNVLPVSDFCEILFSRDRSILVCKELEIQLADDWPLSVVSNVAHLCNRFLLKELHHRHQRLRYRFLDALYENELPQQQPLALELFFPYSVEEFMLELKTRFKNSTGQCFKFELLSPRNCVPTNLRCRNTYGSLVTKKIRDDEDSSDLDRIIVQQGL